MRRAGVEEDMATSIFKLESEQVAQRSLRHRALINATIMAKFPNSTLARAATRPREDALTDAARAQDHRSTTACAIEDEAVRHIEASTTKACDGDPNL